MCYIVHDVQGIASCSVIFSWGYKRLKIVAFNYTFALRHGFKCRLPSFRTQVHQRKLPQLARYQQPVVDGCCEV